MKDLIFIAYPILLAVPLTVFIISAVSALVKSRVLSLISIIIHTLAIGILVLSSTDLNSILATLLTSVLSSVIFGRIREARDKKISEREENKQ